MNKSKFLKGWKEVEAHLNGVEPASPHFNLQIDEALQSESLIVVCEKLDEVAGRLAFQLDQNPKMKRLLVYCLDAQSVARVLKQKSYEYILNHPAFRIAVFKPEDSLDFNTAKEFFSSTPIEKGVETKIIIQLSDSFVFKAEWTQQILGIHEIILLKSSDAKGMHKTTWDSLIGFQHTLKNFETTLKRPDIRNLQSIFKKVPAIVVGAGPSIEEQLEWLHDQQNKAIIIAADTMLKPLYQHDIKPHIIVSIERTDATVELLSLDSDVGRTLLVASSVLKPDCFQRFGGPYSVFFPDFKFTQWLPFKRSRLGTGHSCIGLALGLTSLMECDPIYLMGIDLCWSPTGKSHMQDVSYLNEYGETPQSEKQKKRSFLTKNLNFEDVRTMPSWMMFHHQFSGWAERTSAKVFNLSPFGLRIEKTTPLKLKDTPELKKIDKDIAQNILTSLPYDAEEDIKKSFVELERRILPSCTVAQQIAEKSKILSEQNLHKLLSENPLSSIIYQSILRPSIPGLLSEDASEREESKSICIEISREIYQAFDNFRKDFEVFKKRDRPKGQKLY